MKKNETMEPIYIIKKKMTIELQGEPFEYEELIGKCTDCEAAKHYLETHPGSFISEESTYSKDELFRFETF
jgi:hypothetical protein